MSDVVTTSAPASTPAAPAAPASAPAITFTSPRDVAPPPSTDAPGASPVEGAAPASGESTETSTAATAAAAPAAANKAAARASKDARDARKALETVQAELTALKTAGTSTTDAQAQLDAIRANPGKLLGLGLTADQILAAVLNPDTPTTKTDPAVEALKTEVEALKKAKEDETAAAKDREAKAAAERIAADTKAAHANVAKMVGEQADTYFLVDAEDAPEITDAVVAYCDAEGFVPTEAEARELVSQAARQIQAHREKRFGGRLAAKKPEQSPASRTGIGFTESRKQPYRPEPQQQAPRTITSHSDPLPTPRPKFEIGFTS